MRFSQVFSGPIAAVCGVIVVLLQGRRRKKKLSRSEQQRIVQQAGEAAIRFDYWMRNYLHHGEKTDLERLIEWLEVAHGYAKVAEVLGQRGYKTQPPPTEAEFTSAVSKAKARESSA